MWCWFMISDVFTAFWLGVLTPLTAVCVLPLYPAFISYLSNKSSSRGGSSHMVGKLSLMVVLGVVSFMFILGFLFTFLFQVSLTSVIGVVSPVAFGFLALLSVVLIFDVDLSRFLPHVNVKSVSGRPLLNAFLYGFFFGAVVVPCNPLFIAALFARVTTALTFGSSLLSFVAFGFGIGAPLFLFAVISRASSQRIIGFLTSHRRVINVVSGVIMLVISVYYLVKVFGVFG